MGVLYYGNSQGGSVLAYFEDGKVRNKYESLLGYYDDKYIYSKDRDKIGGVFGGTLYVGSEMVKSGISVGNGCIMVPSSIGFLTEGNYSGDDVGAAAAFMLCGEYESLIQENIPSPVKKINSSEYSKSAGFNASFIPVVLGILVALLVVAGIAFYFWPSILPVMLNSNFGDGASASLTAVILSLVGTIIASFFIKPNKGFFDIVSATSIAYCILHCVVSIVFDKIIMGHPFSFFTDVFGLAFVTVVIMIVPVLLGSLLCFGILKIRSIMGR